MVWKLSDVMRIACVFMIIMCLWLALWSFGASGVVASSIGDSGRWWLLVVRWPVLLTELDYFQAIVESSLSSCDEIYNLYAGFLSEFVLDRCSSL